MTGDGMLTKFAYTCTMCGIAVYRYKNDFRPLPPEKERVCGMCEEGVYVGKCTGCGRRMFKPPHRRGRNPHFCEECRDVLKFAPPQAKGRKQRLAPKTRATRPAVGLTAKRRKNRGAVGAEENDRITRIKAVVGGKPVGRSKGNRRR